MVTALVMVGVLLAGFVGYVLAIEVIRRRENKD